MNVFDVRTGITLLTYNRHKHQHKERTDMDTNTEGFILNPYPIITDKK